MPQDESDLDTIPVQLVIQAGRVEMSINEVDRLAPGMIIPLDRTVDDACDILVNGRRIGRGGFVQSGEMLALRITKLNADG
ncbi:MAG: FliM/FliN family flagellar motor switch protein [Rhodomicrobiaceae bacterium]